MAAARYIMVAIYFWLLVTRLLFTGIAPTVKWRVLVMMALVPLLASNAYFLNKPVFNTTSDREQLADFLVSEGLTTGYATYWNASVLTVMSNYRLKVYHVTDAEMKPLLFLSRAENYYPTSDPYHFLLLTVAESQTYNLDAISRTMGAPLKVLDFRDYKIFVYDKPFAMYLPGWQMVIRRLSDK